MNIKINGFPISSPFGEVSKIHPYGHSGIDLVMPSGTNVISPENGFVSRIVHDGDQGLGNGVYIRMHDGNEIIFGHLSKIKVHLGETIHIGDKVGLSGNTGHSTGAHLHIAVKNSNGQFINPEKYEEVIQEMSKHGTSWLNKVNPFDDIGNSFNDIKEFFEPFRDFFVWSARVATEARIKGFWNYVSENIIYVFKQGLLGILQLNDLFFLMPAIVFMVAYFLIGKNRYTRWIIPLWFAYFVSEVISATI